MGLDRQQLAKKAVAQYKADGLFPKKDPLKPSEDNNASKKPKDNGRIAPYTSRNNSPH